LPSPGHDFDINTGSLLSPILIPRVPGTPNSLKVLKHFTSFFQKSLPSWTVNLHNSTSTTPLSQDKGVPFVNLIASRDPPWAKPGSSSRLTLVAHYDSKISPPGFIGATDSAAPCAMLLHVARSIDSALTARWNAMSSALSDDNLAEDDNPLYNQGIQILLLDGEEAFVQWTDTDSTYGARALAEEWDQTIYPSTSTFRSELQAIQLFLLVDLLGAKAPRIPSYYRDTHWAYVKMAELEERLRGMGLFKSDEKKGTEQWLVDKDKTFAQEDWMSGLIVDDHVPFMKRGVEVLHVIPNRFPAVWHTIDDDGEHLDLNTVEDWAMLLTAFAAEWFELNDFMNNGVSTTKGKGNVRDEL